VIQGELVNGSVGIIVSFSTHAEVVEKEGGIAKVGEPSSGLPMKAPEVGQVPYPVVRFTSGKTMLIEPVAFTVNNAQGDVEACRQQVG
jgi:hypothetical protein